MPPNPYTAKTVEKENLHPTPPQASASVRAGQRERAEPLSIAAGPQIKFTHSGGMGRGVVKAREGWAEPAALYTFAHFPAKVLLLPAICSVLYCRVLAPHKAPLISKAWLENYCAANVANSDLRRLDTGLLSPYHSPLSVRLRLTPLTKLLPRICSSSSYSSSFSFMWIMEKCIPNAENQTPAPASSEASLPQGERSGGDAVVTVPKGRWQRLRPVVACGAGLFSDGYLNGVSSSSLPLQPDGPSSLPRRGLTSPLRHLPLPRWARNNPLTLRRSHQIIGPVNTMLTRLYGARYTAHASLISSIAFAGTVLGMLLFGWTSDHLSRPRSLLVSTLLLILFAALSTGSYGAGGALDGLFAALAASRFLLGIGIGGEYPAGSVGCAEGAAEMGGASRGRWFILFTNVQIDLGFLAAAVVPLVVVLITSSCRLHAAWRICLGLGALPPLSLLYLRVTTRESSSFAAHSMAHTATPWALVIRFYGPRLAAVAAIWFIYDFSAYAFGIYSSAIVAALLGPDAQLWRALGWNVLLTLFYLPGALVGSCVSDRVGPRRTLALGAAAYPALARPDAVGGFVAVYGVFLALGELGPGNNIGLVASTTAATAVRGQYYGVAAAAGKIGAFVGGYVFPVMQRNAPNATRAGQDPFFVSSALCLLSAVLAWFLLPKIEQDAVETEDARFRAFLEAHGWDTRRMGTASRGPEGTASASVERSESGGTEKTARKGDGEV
ncbi:hypothetical protein B0A49_05280 [Cryomyces minteri]|uniref:Major facilitator superfamily (MFS) profile domain-containing protein n=1 Tax=Cryomyces minteri TaxID=331657 RepID=A0A4U0X6W7_9PEZI|nr:hypothetical protein B0A49_05280 [Cryomyces minteri]